MVTPQSLRLPQPSSGGLFKPSAVWKSSFLLAAFCLSGVASSLRAESPVRETVEKKVKISCQEGLAAVRKAVLADPDRADRAVVKVMLQYASQCECVGEIAKAGLRALPQKDGVADSRMLAAMVKSSLTTIYREIPCASSAAEGIVLTALDCLNSEELISDSSDGKSFDGKTFDGKTLVGAAPDPRAVSQILMAALSVLATYDPALIDGLLRTALVQFPDAGSLITQLRTGVLNANSVRPRVGTEPPTVEPNLQPALTKE